MIFGAKEIRSRHDKILRSPEALYIVNIRDSNGIISGTQVIVDACPKLSEIGQRSYPDPIHEPWIGYIEPLCRNIGDFVLCLITWPGYSVACH